MKITISVGGKFHAFNLAKYFADHDVLDKLVTSYPKFLVKKNRINSKHVISIVIKEIIMRVYKKIFSSYPREIITSNLFDFVASFFIPKYSDVYIIFSSYCLYTMRKIRKKNPSAIFILERSSSHILEQNNILKKVSSSYAIDPLIVKKQLKEYEEVDYIMVCSDYIKQTFIKHGYPNDKLLLNYLGVDLQEFPYQQLPQFSKLIIGYAGAISARKNIIGLIRVIKNLVEKGLDIELHLVGSIVQGEVSLADLRQHFIKYSPAVPQSELLSFYKNIHVFVLNSIEDGFGMVVLQAMSSGRPVIVSDQAGSSAIISDYKHGFIVPAQDDLALSEKISWFYNNTEKIPSIGLNNRSMIEENFSWEKYGENYLNLILKLIYKQC